jgi:hypothetical protein
MYLLSLYTPTQNSDKHFESIKKLDGEHIKIKLDKYPGHLEKYFFIPDNLDKDRYVVFLDTDDVLVQTNFPYKFSHDLYLSGENTTHDKTMWVDAINQNPQWAFLMNQEVINCGTWAMKAGWLYEYIGFLRDSPLRHTNLDQLHFNWWVRANPNLSKAYDNSLFCALYRNYYTNDALTFDGKWKFRDRIITAVHANGDEVLKEKLWKPQ